MTWRGLSNDKSFRKRLGGSYKFLENAEGNVSRFSNIGVTKYDV
jgi:hypothetical protein